MKTRQVGGLSLWEKRIGIPLLTVVVVMTLTALGWAGWRLIVGLFG